MVRLLKPLHELVFGDLVNTEARLVWHFVSHLGKVHWGAFSFNIWLVPTISIASFRLILQIFETGWEGPNCHHSVETTISFYYCFGDNFLGVLWINFGSWINEWNSLYFGAVDKHFLLIVTRSRNWEELRHSNELLGGVHDILTFYVCLFW